MDEIDAIERGYEDAHALAALKIQQRARGMRDRRRYTYIYNIYICMYSMYVCMYICMYVYTCV
jgi:hypothetical protein